MNRTIIEESPFSQLLFGRKRFLHFNVEAGNSPLSVALSLYLGSLQASKLEEGKYAVKWVEEEGEGRLRANERAWHAGRDVVSSVASKSNLLQVGRASSESWQPLDQKASISLAMTRPLMQIEMRINSVHPRRTLWLENSEIACPPAILRSAALGTRCGPQISHDLGL